MYYVIQYYWCSIIFFSFPSFHEFHRVVPLLQTCSTSKFVYDRACFCVYVYLWIYLPHREKTWSFCVSDPCLLHLISCPPIVSIYLPTTCHYYFWLSNTPLCTYTPQFLDQL
jgi:hypothetical protein